MKKTSRYKQFSFSKIKNSNFGLFHIIALLTFQQLFILFPFLSPDFKVHRWNDDFVIFNEWALRSSSYEFIPKSIGAWLGQTRSRDYMTRFLVDAFRVLGENQHIFLITEIICWFVALILLAILFSKMFPAPAALLVTLLVGSSPYRTDFFPFMQGSGYTVVFLLFSIAIYLLYLSFRTKRIIHHNIFICSSLLTLYISFFFYEIAIVATGFFSILFIYFSRNSQLILSKKRIYFEAPMFILIGTLHTLIMVTASNPTWNRAGIHDLNFANLTHYFETFTINYSKQMLNPFIWIFSPHLLVSHLMSLLKNGLFLGLASSLAFLTVFLILQLNNLERNKSQVVKLSKINRHFQNHNQNSQKSLAFDKVYILVASLFLILSPYIGFLTFSGGMPVRLSLLAIPGFALIIGLTFIFFESQIVSVKNRSRLLCFYLLIPGTVSIYASYQSQGISSVSNYDNQFESNLLSKLPEVGQIKFPIILQIATPACAESNFWGSAYGGSIWGSGAGQLNLANDLHLLSKKNPDISRTFYIPISVNLPPAFSKIASHYCQAGKALTIPEKLLPQLPKIIGNYPGHMQYYIDPNLNVTELKSS
jgi:hypothetical protein